MANEKPVGENKTTYVPVTYEQCEHIEGAVLPRDDVRARDR
ncbi:MAG: hypothetical protein QOE51_2067 [Actinoplanes sp.]|nr:hypothetical protein [Actinoplanes sp.]